MAKKRYGDNPIKRFLRRAALSRVAKSLVNASIVGEGAGDDILYRLPGVFTMSISYHGQTFRLIKEANEFRIMKPSEKSDVLLEITLTDGVALAELYLHISTWQKIYAEGRMTFAGKTKYLTLVMRVAAARDKGCLPPNKYEQLYGE